MNVDKLSQASQTEAEQPPNRAETPLPVTATVTSPSESPPLAALSALVSPKAHGDQGAYRVSARFRLSQPSRSSKEPNTITNDSKDTQFFPLVNEIRNHDERYLYVTHGTLLDNVPSIAQHGLDPLHGGGGLGAASYETMRSSDARGNLKYAHDPNISLKYSNEPANHNKVGVQLEARVQREHFQSRFTTRRVESGDWSPFWRAESGGENQPAKLNDNRYRQSMARSVPMDEHGSHVWSSETNQHIPPEDVRVIGVSVPPGGTVDVSELKTLYGTDPNAK